MLRFKNKSFKIMMFSDLQENYPMCEKTKNCINRLLDEEKPDFVISVGDNSNGQLESSEHFKKYAKQFAEPMESRNIYWSHVFGNHDEEFIKTDEINKENQQKIFEEFPHCLSEKGPEDIDGIGNYVLPVKSENSEDIVFNIWGLDSGSYLHKNKMLNDDVSKHITEINNKNCPISYDIITFRQILWYWNTSVKMEQEARHKIPGLMFFHIPLPEHRIISMSPIETQMIGGKNEDICNPPLNSGLFTTVLQRGDIKGIFSGHDHINDFVGTLCGVMLGYDGGIGYGTYGFNSDIDAERNKVRGARFFIINEDNPSEIKTYMRYGREFGIL